MSETSIEWPHWSEEEKARNARFAELSGMVATSGLIEEQPEPNDDWLDELLETWPESVDSFTHPGDWRPSVRESAKQSILRTWDIYPDHTQDALFKIEAMTYGEWLRQHMIIDAKPASMVTDVLMNYERGSERNLRHVAFTIEPPQDVARRFEQQYLGLEPLPIDQDDLDLDEEDLDFRLEDFDLRICQDGLYAPYDFKYAGERHGGSLPLSAIARALKTSPEELSKRLRTDGIDETDRVGDYVMPWNLIRLDEFLLMARPHPEDPEQILVGRVQQLTNFGSYLLEEFLRAYEAGTKA